MNVKFLLFLSVLTLVVSCKRVNANKEIDEGKVMDNVYSSNAVGWTMTIPDGWQVASKVELAEAQEKGMDAIEEVYGEQDASKLTQLINFKKNNLNLFQSSIEPFKLEYDGEWEDNRVLVNEMIYNTFTHQGVLVDTSTRTEEIDGLSFRVLHVTVKSPDGESLMEEDIYGRWINGYDFSMILAYNNKEDQAELLRTVRSSKFSKD